jgi:hypothetical protein
MAPGTREAKLFQASLPVDVAAGHRASIIER